MTNTKSEILVQFHEWPTHYCLGPLRTLFWTSLQASVLKTSFAGPEFHVFTQNNSDGFI